MALIKCVECGKMYSDRAKECPKCACPTSEQTENSIKNKILNANKKGNCCPKCHGSNIEYSFIMTEQQNKGRAEVRKKSIITRTGNQMGRKGMILATGGLWALTPKKSKYSEKKKGKTTINNQKVAICQDCGHSWDVK